MASLNRVQLIGNLGKPPETKYMTSGDAVTNFSMAMNESWTDKASGEKKERAEWVNIVVFGRLAEIAGEYLQKGSQCYCEGRLQTRKWQDKEGNDRWSTEVVVDKLILLGKREDREEREEPAPKASSTKPTRGPAPAAAADDDDPNSVPF